MKILSVPHPSLRSTANPIKIWNKKIDTQIQEMIKTLANTSDPQGIGLAGTQVGINKAIFIIFLKNNYQIFINPKITQKSKKMLSHKYKYTHKQPLEGCLSIPNVWGFVDRPYLVTLEYQLPHTLETTSQEFSDLQSSYVQHELDHLHGILFTDHILKQNGVVYTETPSGLKQIEYLSQK